jgi:hypothetical protein
LSNNGDVYKESIPCIPSETTTDDLTIVQITSLKSQIAETDYKIIKCIEYQLVDKELPYDITQLHADRQTLRDQINILEVNLVNS